MLTTTAGPRPPVVEAVDWIIFAGLETLGILAIVGNLALITVLLRNKYLNRPSFILMLSLAIADVMHGLVTTCYFYPPIVLKYTHMPELGIRLYNIVDWTAWSITLTHMSGICLDRLIAIMLYGRYNVIVTIPRVRTFSLCCWFFFLLVNTIFFFFEFCCLIRPLAEQNFYTFGYIKQGFNVYVLTYTPLEIITISILSVSNPITLVQLYRRHKRKVALRMQGAQRQQDGPGSALTRSQRSQWQRASTMLLEMSMKMGQKHVTNDVRELAQRRANRQQQRILLQITVVALIFYAYMTAYYISYYITALQTTYAMVFNSFFYSTTHMINPVIYFSLNSEMRKQLRNALRDFFYCLTRKRRVGEFESRMNSQYNNNSTVKSTCPRPNRSTSNQLNSLREMHLSESLTKLVADVDDSPIIVKTSRRGSLNLLAGVATNKVPPEERTALLDGLIRVLQASESRHSRLSVAIAPTEDGMVRRWPFTRQSHSLDIPVQSTGKYVRVSMTAHELCEVLADELKEAESSPEEMARCSLSMQHLAPPRMTPHFSSLHVLCERRNDTTTTESEEDSPLRFTGSSSSTSSRPTAWLPLNTQDSLTLLIREQSTSDSEEEEDDEEDIAYL